MEGDNALKILTPGWQVNKSSVNVKRKKEKLAGIWGKLF